MPVGLLIVILLYCLADWLVLTAALCSHIFIQITRVVLLVLGAFLQAALLQPLRATGIALLYCAEQQAQVLERILADGLAGEYPPAIYVYTWHSGRGCSAAQRPAPQSVPKCTVRGLFLVILCQHLQLLGVAGHPRRGHVVYESAYKWGLTRCVDTPGFAVESTCCF